MATAWNVIDEERLVGRRGIELPHVADRLVRHVGGEVVARLADPRKDLPVVLEKVGGPRSVSPPMKGVEVVEAHTRRPMVEWATYALLEGRRVVVLTKPGRGIAIVLQDPADGCVVLTDDRIIARETGGKLGDHAKAARVVVAAGDQRRPRGRAQRSGVELRIAQARLGYPIQRRSRNDTPKVPPTP